MRQLAQRIPLSLLGLALLLPSPAPSQLASLISDPVTEGSFGDHRGSEPRDFVVLGRRAVFTASHPQLGVRLWGTDGTPEGTELLGDVCPGCDAGTFGPAYLGSTQSRFFFAVSGGLWVTDGTRRGTLALLPAARFETAAQSVALGGELYFFGFTPDTGWDLWASDGAPAGTRPVTQHLAGFESAFPRSLTVQAGRVYFLAQTAEGDGLWASDGTPEGTERVLVFPFHGTAFVESGLTPAGNRFFFYVRDSSSFTLALWASDGTAAGTREVMRLPRRPGFEPSTEHRVLGDRIFFLWHDGPHGIELWSSDGTPSGTVRITNFGPESPFSNGFSQFPAGLARLGNQVFVAAEPGQSRLELWTTEADRIRMDLVANLRESDDCFSPLPGRLVQTGSHVFYQVCDGFNSASLWATTGQTGSSVLLADDLSLVESHSGVHRVPGASHEVSFLDATQRDGVEIFSSDGTVAGTRQRTRLPGLEFSLSNFSSSLASSTAVVAGAFLFGARNDSELGNELWAVAAGPETTRLVADLVPASASSNPQDPVEAGVGAFLLQSTVDNELALWYTNGAEGHAQLRFEISEVGCHSFRPVRLVRSGERIFLLCEVSPLGNVVMLTDGTVAGTRPLLQTGGSHPAELQLAELGDQTYIGGGGDGGLLRTDGTPEGSEQFLSPIELGAPGLTNLTAIGHELYFVAGAGRVFRTDGTQAGTRLLLQADGFSVVGFWPLGNQVYFLARLGSLQSLWRTDGTPEGTHQGVNLNALEVSPVPRQEAFAVLNGELFFLGQGNRSPGGELWRSDGSQGGTVHLRGGFDAGDWFALDGRSPLVIADGFACFPAREDDHGEELWCSDGTPEGTVLVADLQPGPASSRPRELTVAGDRLFFTATGGAIGNELWVTDGTAGGTRLVHDLAPGLVPSSPEQLTVAGSHLLFTADDDLHGRELWSLPLDETGCVATGQALCLAGGRFRVEADWRDFQGNRGRGAAVPLTADTGTFWFFDPANVEVVLKVLDGRPLNEHFWTFYGALSSVEYQLTITDAATGVARRYANASGNLASRADTESFGPNGASVERYVLAREAGGATGEVVRVDSQVPRGGSCAPSSDRLCLAGGRFALEATWRDFAGNQGVGMAVPLSGDTGYFWFFADANVEVVAKVLDGTALNGHHWVFYGALSSVEYTVTVTDTQTGAVRTYRNPAGNLASVADTGAF